jgi:tRNA nucleotidyltransferase (CCA-adding enzyme)
VPEIVRELEAKAAELNVQESAAKPILMGRHLLELGFSPGPMFKQVLDAAYEAQLEGKFFALEEAIEWLGNQGVLTLPDDWLAKLKERKPA